MSNNDRTTKNSSTAGASSLKCKNQHATHPPTSLPFTSGPLAKSSFPSIRAVHVCFCPTVIQAVSQRSVGTSVQLYPDMAGSQLIGRMDATITGSAKDGIVRLAVDLQWRKRQGGKIRPKPRWQQKDSSERAIVSPLWGG